MSKRISRKTAIAGLAAAGVLGVGIAIPTVALAQGADPNTTGSPNPPASQPAQADRPDRDQLRQERRDALAEALAAELGVDKEKVAAALEKVREQLPPPARTRHEGRSRGWGEDRAPGDGRLPAAERQARLKERLDQAVKDGKLTQEQADAILKAAEAGVLNGPAWLRHGPGAGDRGPK